MPRVIRVEETPNKKEKTESNEKVFKPIKRSTVPAQIETSEKSDPAEHKSTGKVYALDEEGMAILVKEIVSSLKENFVTKDEVETLIIKTLQKMAIDGANPGKKDKTASKNK